MWWDGKANEGVQHRINPKYEELGSTLVSIEQVTRVSQNNHSASEQKKRECTETALVIVGLGVKLSQFNQILQSKELAHGWCRIASSNQTQVEPVGVSGWPRLPKPTRYNMARSA
jgi:hypothetical protein